MIVIKHWRINNYLRSDRYKETTYLEEKAQLEIEENGAYTMKDDERYTVGIPGGIPRIEESREDKNSIEKSRTAHPSIEDVQSYIDEKGYHFSAEAFVSYYQSNGWKVGKNPMKDWKAACRTWESRQENKKPSGISWLDIEQDMEREII